MDLGKETSEELDSARELGDVKKLEACLFLSARFMSLQELVALTEINPIILRGVIDSLMERYNHEGSALEVVRAKEEEKWKMDVKPHYVWMINKLATGDAEFTKAEQETLAVIAYKAPVRQSVVIKIRGNKAYEHVKKFLELGLVKAKQIGHTLELQLSNDFYDYFHLGKKEIQEKAEEVIKQGEAAEAAMKKGPEEKGELADGNIRVEY